MNPIKETDDISYALVIRYPALYRYRRKCCGLSGESDSMIIDWRPDLMLTLNFPANTDGKSILPAPILSDVLYLGIACELFTTNWVNNDVRGIHSIAGTYRVQ